MCGYHPDVGGRVCVRVLSPVASKCDQRAARRPHTAALIPAARRDLSDNAILLNIQVGVAEPVVEVASVVALELLPVHHPRLRCLRLLVRVRRLVGDREQQPRPRQVRGPREGPDPLLDEGKRLGVAARGEGVGPDLRRADLLLQAADHRRDGPRRGEAQHLAAGRELGAARAVARRGHADRVPAGGADQPERAGGLILLQVLLGDAVRDPALARREREPADRLDRLRVGDVERVRAIGCGGAGAQEGGGVEVRREALQAAGGGRHGAALRDATYDGLDGSVDRRCGRLRTKGPRRANLTAHPARVMSTTYV